MGFPYCYPIKLVAPNRENQELQVGKSEEGLVEVKLQKETNGVIEVWYAGTTVQLISNIISCFVLLGIIICFTLKMKNEKKKINT